MAHQFGVILTPNQKKWGVVVFFLSLFGAVAETLGVSVILPLVQVMLEPEQLMEIEIVNEICTRVGITSSGGLLFLVAMGVIVVYVAKNLYLCFLSYARVKYSTKIQRELSLRMLHSYMKRGYSYFRTTNTSNLLRGISGAVTGVYTVVYQFMRIMTEVLTILCIFVYIVYTDWKMAFSMMVLIGACLVVILYVFKGIMQKAGEVYYESLGEVNKWSLQLFSGIKEVLVLNRKKFFMDNYEASYNVQQKGMVKQTVAAEIPAYVIEGTCVVGIILAVCVRVGVMEDPASYIPQLAAFAMAAFRLLPSVGRISSSFNNCMFWLPAIPEVYENILEAQRYDEACEKEAAQTGETDEEVSFEKELKIDDIVWRYPDGQENVLDHISFSIKKGESVAFVGPSGAGKSTLADIILGLFEPQKGAILIDGKKISHNRKAMAKMISFVPQSVYLIDDTVRRNIAFGIGDDEIDEAAVEKALEQAQMKEFIHSLPAGLDTLVGERGVRFSGGQAQRLAIARALYTDPDILVLDEATSALDTETETAVMEAIDALQGQKTLIIIAHRLTTIKNCDKIFEIAGGKAVEKKYEELEV